MKEIVQDGTEILREIAKSVPEELFGTPELASIIKNMEETLDPELEGVALAAPQIAVPYRIFIVRKDRTVIPPPMEDTQGSTLAQNSQDRTLVAQNDVYINPEIVKTSRKYAKVDEGCLSVRGIYGTTKRHERVTIRARNIDGSQFERGAGGLMAQIFEHETDHLNGILFIDNAEHLVEITHEHNA
jgi:peptide deformylase